MNLLDQFNQFFSKYNGKPVEVEDSTNKFQCFDLAFAWVDFIKVPREAIRHLHAFEIWTLPTDTTIKFFEMIPNTQNGVPEAGDIVVFSNKVGVSGHVSISTGKGDTSTFESFDQNWNSKQFATPTKHDYKFVLGWLRLRTNCDDLVQQLADTQKKLTDLQATYQEFQAKYATDMQVATTQIENLQKSNSELTTQLGLASKAVTDANTLKDATQVKLDALQKLYDAIPQGTKPLSDYPKVDLLKAFLGVK